MYKRMFFSVGIQTRSSDRHGRTMTFC